MPSPTNTEENRSQREQLAQVANAAKEVAGQVKAIKILAIVYLTAAISIGVGTTALTLSGFLTEFIREGMEESLDLEDSKSQESVSSSAGDDLLSAGDAIPAIRLPDADGKFWSNSDWEGQLVLLNFWATWCAPCRKEMPLFDEVQKKYAESDFTVIAISVDRKGWEVVRPYLDKLQPTYPVLLADESTTEGFGKITSLPTTFFVHRNGRVHAKHMGSLSRSHLENHIESLLSNDPSEKHSSSTT